MTCLEKGILVVGNGEWKVLLSSDSKAAIQAIKNERVFVSATIQGVARQRSEIKERQCTYWTGNTLITCVKSHIGKTGNEDISKNAFLDSGRIFWIFWIQSK